MDGVNTTPATYYVHTDHLHRPIRMTNAAKAFVWSAEYQPWGAVQSLSGPLTLDLRFPGQWFQLEAGLHYNWHRHYDATLGRYTQPDPLGFVDGPGVFGYARSSPYRYVDPDGRAVQGICAIVPAACITPIKVVIEACVVVWTIVQQSTISDQEDDCERQWTRARELCRELICDPDAQHVTGGYTSLMDCAKGLVSEKCGGNLVDYGGGPKKRRYSVKPKK